jgi:copper transport protein
VLREAIPDGDPRLAARLIEGFAPAVEWVRSLGVECQPAVTVLRFGRGHQTTLLNYLRACELLVREGPGCEIVLGDARRLLLEDGEVRGAEVVARFAMLDMEMGQQEYRLPERNPGVFARAAPALVMVGHWGLFYEITPPGKQPFTVLLLDRAGG